jgi:hypothetical protein
MTKAEILEATQRHFDELRTLWRKHLRADGLGVLVFESGDHPAQDDALECEYWTLGALRAALREHEENDEVVYRYLQLATTGEGFPVVIVPREPDSETEFFLSHIRRKQKV